MAHFVKAFSPMQMVFTKKTLASIVKSRGAIVDMSCVKHDTKPGFSKVIANIVLHDDEVGALDNFFYNRFHQHLYVKVIGNKNIEVTIV